MLDHGVNSALAGALETICLVEGEAFCVANLVAQMEQGFISPAHIWSDVKTVTSAAARRVIGARLGGRELDFIVAGFPCQPWSNAGKQLGKLDDRDLWPDVLRAIEVYQPRYVFLENVDGIAGKIDGARRILCDLEKAGYLVKAGLFSSKEIGGTHLRRRWFFLGIAKSEQQRRQRERADGRNGISAELEKPDGRRREGAELSIRSWRQDEAETFTIRRSGSMAKSASREFQETQRREKRGDGAGQDGEYMANGESTGWKGRIGEQGDAGQERATVERNGSGLADDTLIAEREPHDEKLIIARQDTRRDIGSSGGRLAFPLGESIPGRRGAGDVAGEAGKIESEEDERKRRWLTAGDSSLDVRARVPARNDFGAWGIVAEIDPALLPTLSTLAIRRIAERNVHREVAGNLEDGPAGEDLQAAIEREFRRLAHEYSARDHKLRAIGNSVDWKVAMYAFVTLWACMESELCGDEIHELGQIDLFDAKPPEPFKRLVLDARNGEAKLVMDEI